MRRGDQGFINWSQRAHALLASAFICWPCLSRLAGGSPYKGVPLSELYQFLVDGNRMPKPCDCPDEMWVVHKGGIHWATRADSKTTMVALKRLSTTSNYLSWTSGSHARVLTSPWLLGIKVVLHWSICNADSQRVLFARICRYVTLGRFLSQRLVSRLTEHGF